MLRTVKAKAEKNSGPKLTIPVATRTPLQAFQMLRMGQPIDQVAGYYEEQGMLEPDFYMMDKIQKLHALASYKEKAASAKKDIDDFIQADNEAKAKIEAEKAEQKRQQEIQEAAKQLISKQQNDDNKQ